MLQVWKNSGKFSGLNKGLKRKRSEIKPIIERLRKRKTVKLCIPLGKPVQTTRRTI